MKIAVLVLFVGLFLVCNSNGFPVGEDPEAEENTGSWLSRWKAYIAGWDVEKLQNHATAAKAKVQQFIADNNLHESASNFLAAAKRLTKNAMAKVTGTSEEG